MYKVSNNPVSADCELALLTSHFPVSPDRVLGVSPFIVDIGDSWGTAYPEVAKKRLTQLRLTQNDGCRTPGFFLSALVVVLFLRNYRRILLLLNTMLRDSAMANHWARNRGRGSYQAEAASESIVISQKTPGSGEPPAKILPSRRRKGTK